MHCQDHGSSFGRLSLLQSCCSLLSPHSTFSPGPQFLHVILFLSNVQGHMLQSKLGLEVIQKALLQFRGLFGKQCRRTVQNKAGSITFTHRFQSFAKCILIFGVSQEIVKLVVRFAPLPRASRELAKRREEIRVLVWEVSVRSDL